MKKKLLTISLSSLFASSYVLPTFANTIEDTSNSSPNLKNTNIETAIGFAYPDTLENLSSKELKATLKSETKTIEIDLNKLLNESDNNIFNIQGYSVTSTKTIENDKIKTLTFKIDGLESDDYTLTIDGKNYVKTSVDLSTKQYSKRVNISTATTLRLGDLNDDDKINNDDVKILEDNINTSNPDYDINGDGNISIADISIVNANMDLNLPDAVKIDTFDTEIVPSTIINNLKETKIEGITSEDVKLEDMFNGKGLTLTPKAEDSDKKDIVLPIEFNKPQEMNTIEVTVPKGVDPKNIEIVAFGEDDNPIKTDKIVYSDNASLFSNNDADIDSPMLKNAKNNEQTITINLGKRVPVKKVSVTVKPDENNNPVVIQEVKFLKDVVNTDIVKEDFVKYIQVFEENEKVTLKWKEFNNATGYKIYYGTDENNLNSEEKTDTNTITISGLENLKTYYFAIAPINNNSTPEWEGTKSKVVSATPKPSTKPSRPDFVEVKAGDGEATVSWKEAKNANSYNIYLQEEGETSPKKIADGITNKNYKIKNLTNDKEYIVYVSSQNSVGESELSLPNKVVPKKEEIKYPTLPTKNRISNDNIESVKMAQKDNFDKGLYPNGFDEKWLIDGNFDTTWVARRWFDLNSFTFTFKEPKTMDYLIWVPRLDKNYRKSFSKYNISIWTEGQTLDEPAKVVFENVGITSRGENDSYFIFDFPKCENVKHIKIKPIQWDGSPTNMNASEVAFYEYNDIGDRIANLFENSSRTKLKSDVTVEKISELRAEVENVEGFVIDKDILLKELDIAKSLLEQNTENLGVIKDNIFSINPSNDNKKFQKSINNWQPLGVVGKAGEKVTIFADIPEGETVELVPTQFFEEATKLSSSPIKLKNGRNTITIPKIGNEYWDRGGSLYVTYNGNNADKIKLQVIGGTKIPYLELHDADLSSKENVSAKISEFITELKAYVPKLQGNLEHQILNQCEISLPNILLSLPANKILEGIERNASTLDAQVDKVYQNTLAWEELMKIVYTTYGMDNGEKLETRNNIRYMKMFSGAFMYASSNHIGIGYSSVAPLMNGAPTSTLVDGANSNNLFGWGIGHEIGHVMDALGKPEVTNNIYSLMLQTYDGKANTLPSRLELGDSYDKAFKKVSVGGVGIPNDLFTNLVMYWQLHLAYDEAENPMNFYNALHKEYRSGKYNSFSNMDKFAVVSSNVVGKNLEEFFTRWGVKLSDAAKSNMQSLPKEDRAIWYLTDNSRRERLKGTQKQNISITASAEVIKPADNPQGKAKEVRITIDDKNVDKSKVQGYEILRNGKSIGFTRTNTYTDFIGSANNIAFTYSVLPVDILGNKSEVVKTNEVRISYDNTINSDTYEIKDNKVIFKSPTTVTGIKLTKKGSDEIPTNGKFKIFAKVVGDILPISNQENSEIPQGFVLAKDGDFSKNFSNNKDSYIAYLSKDGSEQDKIWAYDVTELSLEGIDTNKYNVEFLSYPGDDIEFLDMGIGRLKSDYVYGENPEDVIKAGSLVVVGKYRGNTAKNEIYIKGKYSTENSLHDNAQTEERLVEGDTLMFDTLDSDGKITSATADGIFVFIPKIQKEEENENLEKLSILPNEIKAEIYLKDNNGKRLTSNTTWVTMPSDESMPEIEIKQ